MIDRNLLEQEVNKQEEWSKCVIFDDQGTVFFQKNSKISQQEIQFFTKAYENRNNTVGKGFILDGEHYEVHRFHPPLIYGRKGNADIGEGICLCRGNLKNSGLRIYMIICYELPIISSRAIPQQIQFFQNHIGTLEQF